MKKAFTILLLSVGLLTSCEKVDIAKNTPECIEDKIRDFAKDDPCEEGASVKEYLFQNELVYVFSLGNCVNDASEEVRDDDCTTLGYIGGLAGNRKINGADFSQAEYKRTVWEK
ncbi:DUF6970 domain-containing protein [Hymenobacter guriensis]|uniref:DUF6970 domain-containing protein n=1 Tax=Hymenobacter guriensis TaxID=2793065 RepID=A0ABS0L673_9BACT|nr:hypothetical protein [Hymenobacter guriensis]MBG8555604.1 hypothetical protein [Hymenobacter guriensis]